MNRQKMLFLLPMILMLSLTVQGQIYDIQEGQLSLRVLTESCKMETINQSIRGQVNRDEGTCSFMLPVMAFQTKDRIEKLRTSHCLSQKEFPVITFSGKFEDLEKWPAKTEGAYKVKLVGQLKILGTNVPFSEYVSIEVEGKHISLGFTTEAIVDDLEMELDVIAKTVRERVRTQ